MLDASWLPDVPMQRIILHWTAGAHRANSTDRQAYHFLIEGDGNVVRGNASIALNSGTLQNGYAAHTLNCNTGSIGVSLCSMAGAKESPFDPGKYPLTQAQWDKAAEVIAQLALQYHIPITPKTILTHAEVQANLGIRQRNKWDITRLPFDPSVRGAKAVGDLLRANVAAVTGALDSEPVPDGARGRVTASSLAFRAAPGIDAPQTGSLPQGTVVTINRAFGGWLNITTPAGYSGWISASYVEIIDGPAPLEPTTPADPGAPASGQPGGASEIIAEIRDALDRLARALS